jgi:glutamyl-tRNA(Gln) amidotransferase subunit D
MKQGDKILLKTDSEEFKGTFIKEDKEFTLLKLSSGYNVSLDNRKIKEKKILEEKKSSEKKQKASVKEDKNLPNISILHTGGTIASKIDYSTGAVVAKFEAEELLSLFPEIHKIANIKARLLGNMQSEMMRFAHYNILAKAAKEEAEKGADGIIITHGTDTLHYSSAALSFALGNLGIPVILVGSQRSSDRPSSDSAVNIISAATFIANSDYSGVAICMHENNSDDSCHILPGLKARKMHTSRRDAFRAINDNAIAKVFWEEKKIEILSDYNKKDKSKKIDLKLFNEKLKIGLLKARPQMFSEEIDFYSKYDGVLIELLGIGHMPTMKVDQHTTENEKILSSIKKLASKIPVAVSPQTIYGRINMNVYSPGRALLEAGAIGNYCDMHPETAYVKLAWLISNYKKEEIKELFEKDLRGEISKRSEKRGFMK